MLKDADLSLCRRIEGKQLSGDVRQPSPIADPQAHLGGLLAAGARAFNSLVEIIQAGQHAGEIIGGDVRQLAFAAWGMVHGLALLLTNRQVPADVRATYGQEQLVRTCLRQPHWGFVPRS